MSYGQTATVERDSTVYLVMRRKGDYKPGDVGIPMLAYGNKDKAERNCKAMADAVPDCDYYVMSLGVY